MGGGASVGVVGRVVMRLTRGRGTKCLVGSGVGCGFVVVLKSEETRVAAALGRGCQRRRAASRRLLGCWAAGRCRLDPGLVGAGKRRSAEHRGVYAENEGQMHTQNRQGKEKHLGWEGGERA